MFNKLMAKFGMGSAHIDLVLEKSDYYPGETIRGELIVRGGSAEQEINKIDVDLMMRIRVRERSHTQRVDRFTVPARFRILPGEQKRFSFSCHLPENLLISGYAVSYHFTTTLDIAGGVDSADTDIIYVIPSPRLQKVLTAFEQLGFREKHNSRSYDGYMQGFEFFPSHAFSGQIRELEFVVALQPDGVRLLLELDLPSFYGEKEVKREVWLENRLLEQPEALVAHLQQVISEMAVNPHPFHQPSPGYGASYGGNPGYGHSYGEQQGYYSSHHRHHGFSGMTGAIGGFAAGMVAEELFDSFTGETIGDAIGDGLSDLFDGGSDFSDGDDNW